MLNSLQAPGGAHNVIVPGNQAAFRSPDHSPRNGGATGIDARLLPPGIEVLVDTDHSRYRFVMRDGKGSNALVQGGRYFLEETEVRIDGSTYGRSLLKTAWIELGRCLEISVSGRRIVTSPVRAIRIAG
jgi:hypothetical protein